MTTGFEQIIYEKKDRIAIITFNRPEKLNSMTRLMMDEIYTAIDDAEKDDGIRVLVFTGAGNEAFSTGADVNMLANWAVSIREESGKTGIRNIPTPTHGSPIPCYIWEHVEKPTIAAINGVAAGMGGVTAYACDIRVASARARFPLIYNRRALVVSGESWFLPRLIGLGPTMHHLLLSDEISAEQALRLGLVTALFPPEDLMKETLKIAERIAKGPRVAMKFTKKAVYNGLTMDFLTAMNWIGYYRAVAGHAGEFEEGTKAFLEKRDPQF